MTFSINNFKGALKQGGLRTSYFDINITNPANGNADGLIPLRCTASSVPDSTINAITVNYAGREVKVAGSRTFADWSVTVIEDEDLSVRNALETWVASMNSPETNTRRFGTSAMNEYKSTALVNQYSQVGELLRSYKFIGLFPTVIGAVTLNWEGNNVATYDVTFAYDYFLPEGVSGNAGGI